MGIFNAYHRTSEHRDIPTQVFAKNYRDEYGNHLRINVAKNPKGELVGWKILSIERHNGYHNNGQSKHPSLKVGDLIYEIAGKSFLGKNAKEQLEIFKHHFKGDFVALSIKRDDTSKSRRRRLMDRLVRPESEM